MHRNLSLSGRWSLCALILFAFAHSAFSQPDYDPGWAKNFRVGVMAGFNIKANFRMNGNFGVSGYRAGEYDDGYVKPDSAGSQDGLTWNWGYEGASQWHQADNQLVMHRSNGFSTSGSGSGQDAPYIGFDMAYGGILWHRNNLRIGWELGFGMLPVKISESGSMDANVSRTSFTFDTGGIILPSPGYHGTADGPGPLIHLVETSTNSSSDSATITGTRTLDATIYTFKLGPTLFWDVNQYIGLQVGAGPALGLVSGDLKFDETFTFEDGGTAHNSGKVSSTDMTYGGYVNALVTFHCVKNGDIYIGAQYMPMGKARIGGGGREAELNLKGQVYVSAGINWPF